ncbi:hypothetical protein CPB86DRAFT_693651, partial [Serendipita vermifera]
HLLTHIPQPIHRTSEMNAILSDDLTSMQSLPQWSEKRHQRSRWDQETVSRWSNELVSWHTYPFLQQDMTV